MARIRFINKERSNIHFIVIEALGDATLRFDEDDPNITKLDSRRWHIVLGQGSSIALLDSAGAILYEGDVDFLIIRDSKGLNVLKDRLQPKFNIKNSAGEIIFSYTRRTS